MKRIHLIITGKVQGVCFRMNTYKVAKGIGVKGTVRNLSTGEVEVFAEGTESQITQLISFCRKGTGIAIVTKILIEFLKPINEFIDFVIKDKVIKNGIN